MTKKKKEPSITKAVKNRKIQKIFFQKIQTYNIRIENNPSYVIITTLLDRCQQKNIQVTCKFIAEKVYTYIYDQTNIKIK